MAGLCSRTPQNVKLGTSTSQSCNDGREMCMYKVVILLIKPVAFFFAVLVAVAFVVAQAPHCYELPTHNKDLSLYLFYSHRV